MIAKLDLDCRAGAHWERLREDLGAPLLRSHRQVIAFAKRENCGNGPFASVRGDCKVAPGRSAA
jgi:hypothetical protein